MFKKFFKRNKSVKNQLVGALYSNDKNEVIKAVNDLIQRQGEVHLKEELLVIVEDWRSDESYAPLWSMIVLGYWHSLEAIPFLLDVLDSVADIWKEAAIEALERLAEKHGEVILDPIEEFIERRLDHDPFDARLYAYSPIAVLTQSELAKSFLVKVFELDDTWQGSIAYDLVKFRDKRILQLFRRAIEYAHRIKDKYGEKDLRDAYCLLAGVYKFNDDDHLRNKPWEERWDDKLNELGKSEEEIDKMSEEKFSGQQANFKLLESEEWFKENKRQNKIRDTYPLADFNLAEYLEIRERGWLEKDFQSALRLSALSDLYSVEEVQKIINSSIKPSEALKTILGDFEFSTDDGLREFTSKFFNLWNNTPREEFQGLTPVELAEINKY